MNTELLNLLLLLKAIEYGVAGVLLIGIAGYLLYWAIRLFIFKKY